MKNPINLPMKHATVLALLIHGFVASYSQKLETIVIEDLKTYFEQYDVTGSILFLDRNAHHRYVYNPEWLDRPTSPASTFKIFNSLVGLETGVIPDTSYTIPWDSVRRGTYAPWHRTNSLKSAFKYSVVWYYQELARRVGAERMNKYVRQNHYGNEDIGPQVDQFWLADLGGKLRITMEEQLDFLERLYDEKLKFGKKNQRLVKAIMLDGAFAADFKMYGKTGAANYDGKSYGWYVGWIEQDKRVFFFATLIESTDPKKILGGGRKGITQAVYQHLRKLRS